LKLSFRKYSLAVGHIDFKNGMRKEDMHLSYPSYFDPTTEELLALTGRIFRVGQRRNMVFTVPIETVGAYFIQFHAVYWRIAFEGQEQLKEEPLHIHAIEQMIYHATGRTTLPDAVPASAPDSLQGKAERLAPP
jgi:hypothetical protein